MSRCPSCHGFTARGALLCPACGTPTSAAHPGWRGGPGKTLLFSLLLVAGIATSAAVTWYVVRSQLVPREADPVQVALTRLQSVITLTTYSEDGTSIGQGSGFIAGPGGLAVTNYHVLAGASLARAQLGDGRGFDVTSIEAFDASRDICVFRIGRWWTEEPDPPPDDVVPLELRLADRARVGERIAVLGSPKGFRNTLSDGLVSAVRSEDGKPYLQFTAPISHGSSGGPIFDGKGRVIGVTVSTREDGQNLNFAIPATELGPFLQQQLGISLEEMRTRASVAAILKVLEAEELLANEQAEEALTSFEAAYELSPYDPGAVLGIALCCKFLDREAAFASWMEKYNALEPDETDQRARLLAMLGRLRMARAQRE